MNSVPRVFYEMVARMTADNLGALVFGNSRKAAVLPGVADGAQVYTRYYTKRKVYTIE